MASTTNSYNLIDADFMAKMNVIRQRREQADPIISIDILKKNILYITYTLSFFKIHILKLN